MRNIFLIASLLVVLSSCNSKPDHVEDEIIGVQSVLWTQLSAEAEALYLQGYNIASQILLDYDAEEGSLPPAVTLDIDETVIDNSPFSVNRKRNSEAYSEEKWAEWCERREATPLPGALKFTMLADSLDIEIFYVSNRHESLKAATIDNLRAYHFPNADSMHVLLKTTSSSKDLRRQTILEDFNIILLVGDNLGDFDGVFDNRSEEFGKTNVREFEQEFGTHFILLPNPMYGSWERAVFPEGMPDEKTVLEVLRGF